jgi:hypothetical protein
MVRSARRYDVYLPLTFNDGRPVPDDFFVEVQGRLLTRFGGITAHQRSFPLRGAWQDTAQIYLDDVIIMTVLDFRPRGSTRFIAQLKHDLLRDLDQLEILITEASLRVH